MFLSIPVLDLLHSQLDIGVDPLSGKLICNLKDIPSRLRQCCRSLHASDLTLTLQSSPEDSRPGRLCIRLSPTQAAVPGHSSMNMSEVPPFHGLAPLSLLDQSEHSAHSVTAEQLIPASRVQDSFRNVDSTNVTYGHSSGGQDSLETIMNQESLWASLQENVPQQSDESRAMSPVSQTLSQISSGSIIEDLAIYSLPDMYAFSNSQYDAAGIQLEVDYARYSGGNATYHCSPGPVNNTMDVQDHPEVTESNAGSASCGSFSIIDLFTPVPHSELSSQTSSAAVSPKYDQITPESHTPTPSHRHDVSNYEEYPTPSSSSKRDSSAEPARESKRELYPCPFRSCGRVLKSMYTQQIHLKTHEGKPQKNFPCTMGCSESFTRHHDRLRHEVAQHGKQCEFSCKRCERFFSSQRMLDRHTCWSWRNGSLRWQLKDFADSSRSNT